MIFSISQVREKVRENIQTCGNPPQAPQEHVRRQKQAFFNRPPGSKRLPSVSRRQHSPLVCSSATCPVRAWPVRSAIVTKALLLFPRAQSLSERLARLADRLDIQPSNRLAPGQPGAFPVAWLR
jgi:hypothetical protein